MNKTETIAKTEVNSYIEHTLLKPTAIEADYLRFIEQARAHKFKGVCVPPAWVAFVASELDQGTRASTVNDSALIVVSVVGFPLGYSTTRAKVFEAVDCVEKGADEVDMVLNLSWFKQKHYSRAQKDIEEVRKAIEPRNLKVIVETSLLTEEEKPIVVALVEASGAKFIKTSTGFGGGGASVADVQTFKKFAPHLAVKASGGIRTLSMAKDLIAAGATRLGVSQSVELIGGKDDVTGKDGVTRKDEVTGKDGVARKDEVTNGKGVTDDY